MLIPDPADAAGRFEYPYPQYCDQHKGRHKYRPADQQLKERTLYHATRVIAFASCFDQKGCCTSQVTKKNGKQNLQQTK